MGLPLGKKTLIQIERRTDPTRRLVDLFTLFEWLLRMAPPQGEPIRGCPGLEAVFRAYGPFPPRLPDLISGGSGSMGKHHASDALGTATAFRAACCGEVAAGLLWKVGT